MKSHDAFEIDRVTVGPSADIFLIAEVGNAHDGNLNIAHAYIDAVRTTGARAIKFQTHIASAESTAREPFRKAFSYVDRTRVDYWRRMEFTPEQWAGLKEHAEAAGLIFLSSPFSPEAVDLLDHLGVSAWKVGSGETNNLPMLDQMARTGKPVLISSGMSPYSELDEAVRVCGARRTPHAVFHCTSMYPTPPDQTGLNILSEMHQRYGCPVGLSDHSGDIFAALAAAALGVDLIEVHICMSRHCFGPDTPASLTPEQMTQLAEGLRAIRTMLHHPLSKEAQANALAPLRRMFNKSIVYRTDLSAGTVLLEEHLAGKKPGDGIPIADIQKYIGRTLLRDVHTDEPLALEDVK